MCSNSGCLLACARDRCRLAVGALTRLTAHADASSSNAIIQATEALAGALLFALAAVRRSHWLLSSFSARQPLWLNFGSASDPLVAGKSLSAHGFPLTMSMGPWVGGTRELKAADRALPQPSANLVKGLPNVVFFIMESTGVSSGLSIYDRNEFLADGHETVVTPFLRSLAKRPDALVFETMYPSMPNTNKALTEIWCGMVPLLDITWLDLYSPVLRECLPNLLAGLGYETAFFSPAPAGEVQPNTGESRDQLLRLMAARCFRFPKSLGSTASARMARRVRKEDRQTRSKLRPAHTQLSAREQEAFCQH